MEYRKEIFWRVLIPRNQQDMDLLATAAQRSAHCSMSYAGEQASSADQDRRRWPEGVKTFRYEVQLGKKDATGQWVPATPTDCDAQGWIPAVFKVEIQVENGEAIATHHDEWEDSVRFEIVNQGLFCKSARPQRHFSLRDGQLHRE